MLFEMAIADAYGAGFEYAPKDFVAKHNDLGGFVVHPKHRQTAGTYTDDTQMALAIAEMITERRPWTRETLAQKFVDVFKRDPRSGYSQRFYWFLREVRDGREFLARIDPRSEKSGAAMRSPPLGLYPAIGTVLELAELNARLTHATGPGIASAQAAALLAHYLRHDLGPPDKIGRFLEQQVPYRYAWSKPWRGGIGPSGLEAVHAAAYVIARSTSLAELLQRAVALTGDVDTVAAMALAAASTSPHFLHNLPRVLAQNLEGGPYGNGA